jgi:hypothetical protein
VVLFTQCILTRGLRGGNFPQVTKCINEAVAFGRENYPFSPKKAVKCKLFIYGGKIMKRFWLVLLSLGLIAAFSTSAFAVDVKVNGEFFVGGLYLNKVDVWDGSANNTSGENNYDLDDPYYRNSKVSTAFLYQRLRVGTDFVVSDCLKLVTRFDAMERIWGGARANVWQTNAVMPEYSAGTRNESENIAFDNVYIDYVSPVGVFQVGYMPDSTWGTVFGNMSTDANRGMIKWSYPIGKTGFTVLANYAKIKDNSSSAVSTQSWYWKNNLNATRTDRDADSYRIGAIYNFKGSNASGQVGVLGIFTRDASERGNASETYLSKIYNINPYFKANIGPVALQGEINYAFGDAEAYEYDGGTIKADSLSAFLDANATFGMVTVGGTFAYLQGDTDDDDDKIQDVVSGGIDYNPCLLLFNNDTVNYWIGGIGGHWFTQVGGPMKNTYFFQGRVGVKPTAKFDALLSLSYASADKKPDTDWHNKDYGFEIDLTGTYKITNNLSYMLGVGYLFTGDYYKADGRNEPKNQDDFILINKLTLNF